MVEDYESQTDAEDSEVAELYGEEADEVVSFKYSIASYGADYPVDGLVKRISNEDIYIPSFQRGYIWPIPKASRFVESLLLGLPVPSIFLSRESNTNKLLVIDGQQRLRTLQYFYKGVIPQTERQFKLVGLPPQFDGATYDTLDVEDRRRLDDAIIHAIIVRQEQPSDGDSSIYQIFERLNTGGVLLAPQEIRACVYHGEFNNLLADLNANDEWRDIFGAVSKRMRDQELILRFFALYFDLDRYSPPMKEFLNTFMGSNRDLRKLRKQELKATFDNTIETARSALGSRPFRPVSALNAAVYDAVMVGLARRLAAGPLKSPEDVRLEYDSLLKDRDFEDATRVGTTQEAKVRRRLDLAARAFVRVP